MGHYLQEQLAMVLKLPRERIDRDRPFGTMGLDSLMALEFTRRVNAGLGTAFPPRLPLTIPEFASSRHSAWKIRIRREIRPTKKAPSDLISARVSLSTCDQRTFRN